MDFACLACHNSVMSERIEPQADRMTWIVFLVILLISLLVVSTTKLMDMGVDVGTEKTKAVWLDEISSHGAILLAALIVPLWLSRFPLSVDNWAKRLPIYLFCFLCFSTFHIIFMVGLRKGLYPLLIGYNYESSLLSPDVWIYELRKDFMAFLMILGIFLTTRLLFQFKLEANLARQDARDTGRITLKSGGRMLFLDAEEILYAKAAGNYVEVFTENTMHLVRITLSSLEALLGEAGHHLRVHRSYIVRKSAISELKPNGEGEAVIFVPNQVQIPVSRNYRSKVSNALSK